MPTKSAQDLVDELLPPYGPYDHDRTVRAAALVDHLLRYLNHATLDAPGDALPWPAAAADLAGGLKAATQKLPQLLSQTGRQLAAFQQMPELANYGGQYRDPVQSHGEAVQHVEQAREALRLAVGAAEELTRHLTAAQNALSPVGLNLPPDADE